MNHIHRLQADLAAVQVALDAKDEIVRHFQTHLAGSKFQGTDADGTRKDRIATADVRQHAASAWPRRYGAPSTKPTTQMSSSTRICACVL